MFDRILRRIRNQVSADEFVVTVHADEEPAADGFNLFDLDACIHSGQSVERQKDRVTGEWKYVIHGASLQGSEMAVVVKPGPLGKLVVVTVFSL